MDTFVNIQDNGFFSLTSSIVKDSPLPNQAVRKLKTQSLNNILQSTQYFNKRIDLLTIDAEGHDFNVLKSLDLKIYNPKMIIIESHFRNFENIRGSDLYQYLIHKGYIFANWVGLSLFFVHPDNDLIKFKFESNTD